MAKAIVDMAIFLEFTDEELLDADTSIEAMEQLAMELQLMEGEGRSELSSQIRRVSAEYEDVNKAQFVEKLPEFLGLE
ncbi:hypothetical protein [Azonexus hydrophilus]|uniref:hypothetical protein n=1 Tax=Azonexus hydrophilus TaxID=418702 RepID=UPI0019626706|nr:hypothetical protein [Azonexus hydrophilus]